MVVEIRIRQRNRLRKRIAEAEVTETAVCRPERVLGKTPVVAVRLVLALPVALLSSTQRKEFSEVPSAACQSQFSVFVLILVVACAS